MEAQTARARMKIKKSQISSKKKFSVELEGTRNSLRNSIGRGTDRLFWMLRTWGTERTATKSRPNCARTRKTFSLFFSAKPRRIGLCFARSCLLVRCAFAGPHYTTNLARLVCSLCLQRFYCKSGRGLRLCSKRRSPKNRYTDQHMEQHRTNSQSPLDQKEKSIFQRVLPANP